MRLNGDATSILPGENGGPPWKLFTFREVFTVTSSDELVFRGTTSAENHLDAGVSHTSRVVVMAFRPKNTRV